MNPDPDDLNFESDDDSILDPSNFDAGGGGNVAGADFDDLEETPLDDGSDAPGPFTEQSGGQSLEDRIFVGEAISLDSLEDDPSANANPFDDLDAPAAPPDSADERSPATGGNNTESGNQQSPAAPGAPRGDAGETAPAPEGGPAGSAPNNLPAGGADEQPPAREQRQESQPYRAPRDAAGNPVV